MGKKRSAVEVAEVVAAVEIHQDDASEEIPKGQLGDWGDKMHPDVRQAADEYISLLREHNAAKESMNVAKEDCIVKMKEHGVLRVQIDEGGKYLVCEDAVKLVTKAAKKEKGGNDDE